MWDLSYGTKSRLHPIKGTNRYKHRKILVKSKLRNKIPVDYMEFRVIFLG